MKKLGGYLLRLLFPASSILMHVPKGVRPDANSLQFPNQFMVDGNIASPGRVPITTAGTNTTLTALQVLYSYLILAAGASGGFTLTLPSTASIIALMSNAVLTDGTFSFLLVVKNNAVGQTGTLTAGDVSTTITGTATIATNTTRTFLVTVTSKTTLQIDNLGSMAL